MRRLRWPLLALPLVGLCAAGLSCRARGGRPEPSSASASSRPETLFSLPRELETDDSQARRALFRLARVYPTGRLPQGAYGRAVEQMKRLEASITPPPAPPGLPASSWKPLGTSPLDVTAAGYWNVKRSSGRATAIASPEADPKTLYLGTAQGGLWKSVDGGQSWVALTDDQPSLAVGDVALDPKKPGRVWVGTGEGHTGSISYYGRGLLLSDDGGSTWNRPGGDRFSGVSIVRVLVHPKSDVLYVATLFDAAGRGLCHNVDYEAADQGVFRSNDGGKSWTKLLEGPMTDLEADFSGPLPVLFAARYGDGLHRLEDGDGGAPPKKLDLPDKSGSPGTLGVQIAVAPSDPKVIYASATVTNDGFSSARGTVFRSTDGGSSWAELPKAPDHCHDQCDYDNALTVAPDDPGTIYFGGSLCSVWKATGATSAQPSFSAVSIPGGDCADQNEVWIKGYVHPDLHSLFVHPTSGELWALSDGGVALSADGGASWTTPNEGLATLQFYGGCLPPGDPKTVLGGTQDNGFAAVVGNSAWKGLLTGDGIECVTSPDGTLIFNVLGGFTVRATLKKGKPALDPASVSVVFDPSCQSPGADGCGDAQRATLAPLAAAPDDPATVYTATYRVYRSTDGGQAGSWKPISDDVTGGEGGLLCSAYGYGEYPAPDMVVDMAVAAGGHIYTTSAGGAVAASHDGGKTFAVNKAKGGLPSRYASGVAVDAASPTTIWVAYSGFSAETPAASGHVFRSTDGGKTFTGAEPGGVDAPVDSIAAHPVAPGVVFVGTDVGALASYDAGKSFAPVAPGLPNVAVYSLLYDARQSRLVALTHGRAAWQVAMPSALAASPGKLSIALKPAATPAAPLVAKIKNAGHPGALARPLAASSEAWAQVPAELSPVAGSAEADLTVTLDPTGLDLGVHTATITLTDAISTSTPALTVPVELTISPSAPDQGQGGQGGHGGQAGAGGSSGNQTGSSGQAGSSGAGGLPTPAPQPPPAPDSGDDGGCGCQVPVGSTPPPLALLALLALGTAVAARRRRGPAPAAQPLRTGAPRSSR